MKQRLRKMVSILLVLTLCLSLIAISTYSPSAAEVNTEKVSANAVKTQDEAVAWLRAQGGASYDFGNFYDDEGNLWGGTQCVEFVKAYVNWLMTGDPWHDVWNRPTLNGNTIWQNSLWGELGWTVYYNSADFVPQPGDIFSAGQSNYIHTGVVISSNVNTATIADSNSGTSNPYDGDPVRIHDITWRAAGVDSPWAANYFIRPNFASNDTSAPTISNARAENATTSSFDIKCDLSDNVGVTRIWLVVYGPSGEKQYGLSASNGAFTHTISTSEYGGPGTYSVHIYAFDAKDNSTKAIVSNIQAGKQFTASDAINLGDNFVAKIIHVNSGKRISAYSDNAVILQYKDNSDNQNWRFTRNSDGSYRITNVKLNQCLDVYDSQVSNETKIVYWTPTDNNNQKWYIIKNKSGYGLVPKHCPWAAIDVPGNKTDDGTAIQQYQWNESNAQNFTIDYVGLKPTATVETNGHKYEYFNNTCTWWQAYRTCEKLGGHLVSITSKSENDKMLELTKNYTGSVWIGATRFESANWYWVNSEPYFENNFWATGEPNNTGGKEESAHLYISGEYKGKWNDVSGERSIVEGFICEYDDIVNESGYVPVQTAVINGYTYDLYDNSVDWQTAKKICEKKGGVLASITSSSEYEEAWNLIKKGSKSAYWVGYTDIENEGRWTLIGGAFTFTSWGTNEPNNSLGVEDYAAIFKSNGKWNDFPGFANGYTSIGFICKTKVKVEPTGIKLNNSTLTLEVGKTETLTATISPSDAYDKSITWTSSNTNTATVSNGTITAKSAGTAMITAKTTNGKIATCMVTVKATEVAVTGITLNKSSLALEIDKTENLIAEVSPTDATNKGITWTSSNPEVATVTGGKVTAKTVGEATITAKTANGKTATCKVVVKNNPDPNAPILQIESKTAKSGNSIAVKVLLKNNPGIWGLDAKLNYDKSVLTLTDVTNGDVFSSGEWTQGDINSGQYTLSYEASGFDNVSKSGTLATLLFKVNDNAKKGTETQISLSYNNGDIISANFEDVHFETIEGTIKICDFIYGDINGDGAVNKKDSLLLKMYLANNQTQIDKEAADVFPDGNVNKKDSLYLKQYLAGLNVILGQ